MSNPINLETAVFNVQVVMEYVEERVKNRIDSFVAKKVRKMIRDVQKIQ